MIWAAGDRPRLSPRARNILSDGESKLFVSASSAWELATKYRLGKLPEAEFILVDFVARHRALGFEFITVTVEHSLVAGSFAMNHKDPFDRLIAAQAKIESLPLLSADAAFDEFPIQRIW